MSIECYAIQGVGLAKQGTVCLLLNLGGTEVLLDAVKAIRRGAGVRMREEEEERRGNADALEALQALEAVLMVGVYCTYWSDLGIRGWVKGKVFEVERQTIPESWVGDGPIRSVSPTCVRAVSVNQVRCGRMGRILRLGGDLFVDEPGTKRFVRNVAEFLEDCSEEEEGERRILRNLYTDELRDLRRTFWRLLKGWEESEVRKKVLSWGPLAEELYRRWLRGAWGEDEVQKDERFEEEMKRLMGWVGERKWRLVERRKCGRVGF